MTTYISRSATSVKFATIGAIILVLMIPLWLFTTDGAYNLHSALILSALVLITAIYFYANSLDKVLVKDDRIILKKNLGQIKIAKSEILDVCTLGYSNLSLTYGSKGVFGFIGNTMDNSISLVKDKGNMIRITTKEKKYIISTERPDELVREIKNLRN